MFMLSKNIIVEEILLFTRERVSFPIIHIIRRGRGEEKERLYNLKEIESHFLTSYILIICKFIQMLFGPIYCIHSFTPSTNTYGFGTEVLSSYGVLTNSE